MRKGVLTLMALSLLVFLGSPAVFGQAAAQQPATPAQQSPPPAANTHHAMHHAAHHAAHHHAANPEAKYQAGVHTASGTLTTVDTNGKLLVVTGSDGTPFDFVVTRRTHISVNGQKGNLDALGSQANQQVTVKFRDHLRSGLVAQSVQVGG